MNDFAFEELQIGFEKSQPYAITPDVYEKFIGTFGDVNPLHVDAGHALKNGFPGVVMHGAILQGFLSHFVGMVLPGKRAILLSCEIRYAKPNFLKDTIQIVARVKERIEEHRMVTLEVIFKNETQGYTSARAKVQVGSLVA